MIFLINLSSKNKFKKARKVISFFNLKQNLKKINEIFEN